MIKMLTFRIVDVEKLYQDENADLSHDGNRNIHVDENAEI